MKNKELHGCVNLIKLLEIEKKIIEKHLNNHKWLNHIKDSEEGIIDFIKKFGWIMKEMYCECVCEEKETCEVYKKKLKKNYK